MEKVNEDLPSPILLQYWIQNCKYDYCKTGCQSKHLLTLACQLSLLIPFESKEDCEGVNLKKSYGNDAMWTTI